MNNTRSRREFLAFAAASPLLAQQQTFQYDYQKNRKVGGVIDGFEVKTPKDALNIKDMENIAQQRMAIPHWGYLQTGVDDQVTLIANDLAPKKIAIRPRRMLGASKADLTVKMFEDTFASPIFTCPVASNKQYHAEGEIGVARACKARNMMDMLSSDTTTPIETVAQEYGKATYFQMYSPDKWEDVEKFVKRVESVGTKVMAITVDNMGGRNTEIQPRLSRMETRACADPTCHGATWKAPPPQMRLGTAGNWTFGWEWVDRIRKITKMHLMIKGIVRGDDAMTCLQHGIEGIYVTNHGGRNTEECKGSLEVLQEVIQGCGGRIPVIVDGGMRRGSDIFKALALGATMVGVGRPYCWGLGAFGQAGVERVLDILNNELAMTMRQCGCKSVAEINPGFLRLGADWLGKPLAV